jgi:oligoribonuclease
MNDWCKEHHGKSGLTAKVPHGKPIAEVEAALLALAEKHFPGKDVRPVLAGNSIGNDKRFVDAYMKKLSAKLHYRMVDVSSFKEVFRERYGFKVDKKGAHRALDDIQESITELKTYLSHVNLPPIV